MIGWGLQGAVPLPAGERVVPRGEARPRGRAHQRETARIVESGFKYITAWMLLAALHRGLLSDSLSLKSKGALASGVNDDSGTETWPSGVEGS